MLTKMCSVCSAILILAMSATAQTKPTKGTVQLPGDNGKVGVTYQLGTKDSELHFTLDSVSVASRYSMKSDAFVAGKEERLLVVTFTVQNPLKTEQSLGSSTFRFTAISPEDKNFEFRDYLYQADTKNKVSNSLKPAQKTKCTVVFPIYAEGPITKLMVQKGSGAVLRYDLREKTGKMTSAFSADGISLGDTFNATLAKPFDFGGFDVEVQEVVETNQIGAYQAISDKTYFLATVKFTNTLSKPLNIGFQYFAPSMNDENGEKIDWRSDIISPSSGKSISQEIAPGEFVRGSYIFTAPKGTKPARLKLMLNSSGRTAIFKLL